MKPVNILYYLLAFCLLLPILTACNNETEKKQEFTDSQTVTETAAETKSPYEDDLGEFNFEGRSFRVFSVSNNDANVTNFLMKFDIEEQTGDLVYDALYTRNRQIEERFNIIFEDSYSDVFDGPTKELRSIVTSGDDAYDLMQLISRDALKCAFEGMIIKVNDLPYLDVSKPYYSHDVNNALTVNGIMYFAYSDACINMLEHTSLVTFNKKMAGDFQTGDLYSLVRDGGWTLDEFFSDCTLVSADLNGDEKMTKYDRFGVVGEKDMFFGTFWLAAGITTIAKDENDIPYFAAQGNEKFYSLIEKVSSFFTANKVHYNGESRDKNSQFFKNGSAFFDVTILGHLNGFRDMENDFGVVPFPKYNEEQDRYYSRVVDGWIHIPPVTNTDPELTSVIMEALGSASAKFLIPAYYDQAMVSKVLRDEDSVEMLELIRSTRIIDLGENPWQDTIRNTYIDLIVNKKTDAASATEKIADKVQKLIDSIMETIENG